MSAGSSSDDAGLMPSGSGEALIMDTLSSTTNWLTKIGFKAANESLYNRYSSSYEKYELPYVWPLSELESLFVTNQEKLYSWFTQGPGMQLGVLLAALYLLLIFSLQAYMEHRPRFQLRGALISWNIFLAIFSLVGFCRSLPEALDIYRRGGLYQFTCDSRYMLAGPGCWAWLFAMSKLPEMGDTVFIVLRKQRLIFLHWYHHLATMLYTWLCFVDWAAPARLFMIMNFGIHAVMYSYYAGRALRLPIPRVINVIITSTQLSQMLVGAGLAGWAWYLKQTGVPCQISYFNLHLAYLMYLSYVVLFGNFFYQSYIAKPAAKKMEEAKKRSEKGVEQLKMNGEDRREVERNRYGVEVSGRDSHHHEEACRRRQQQQGDRWRER